MVGPARGERRSGADGASPPPVVQEPPYAATVRSIGRTLRTRILRLEGREQELADVSAFATGHQGYRWLVGGAFTGKTALMFHAVTAALPDTVDVVSYFLRKVASDADSGKFLAAVIPQLAALCGTDPDGYDEHTYRSLWERAAARASERAGTCCWSWTASTRTSTQPAPPASPACSPTSSPTTPTST